MRDKYYDTFYDVSEDENGNETKMDYNTEPARKKMKDDVATLNNFADYGQDTDSGKKVGLSWQEGAEDYEVDVDEYLKTGEPVQKLPEDKRSFDVETMAEEWGYGNLSPEAEKLQDLDYDLGGYSSYDNNEDYKNAIKSKLTYPASQISGSVIGELEDINHHHFIKVLMELGAPKPTGESMAEEVSWFECNDCKFIGMTQEDALKHEQYTGHSIGGAGLQSVTPTFLKSEETELQMARESLPPLNDNNSRGKSNLTRAFESGASIEDIYSKVGDITQERGDESELNDIYANVNVKLNLEKY